MQDAPDVRARLLVGCDGNASAVWDHLFPEDPLQYTGVSVWRTTIPKPADWFELGTAVTWEGTRPRQAFSHCVVFLTHFADPAYV